MKIRYESKKVLIPLFIDTALDTFSFLTKQFGYLPETEISCWNADGYKQITLDLLDEKNWYYTEVRFLKTERKVSISYNEREF